MVPNEGTPSSPKLVWNDAVMVSPVDGGYPPMVDKRGFLWIATSYYNNWAPAGVNGPKCDTTTQQAATATCLYSTIVFGNRAPSAWELLRLVGPSAVPISAYSVAAGGGSITLTANNSFTENQAVTISAKSGDPLYALNGLNFYVSGTGLSSTAFQISSSTYRRRRERFDICHGLRQPDGSHVFYVQPAHHSNEHCIWRSPAMQVSDRRQRPFVGQPAANKSRVALRRGHHVSGFRRQYDDNQLI